MLLSLSDLWHFLPPYSLSSTQALPPALPHLHQKTLNHAPPSLPSPSPPQQENQNLRNKNRITLSLHLEMYYRLFLTCHILTTLLTLLHIPIISKNSSKALCKAGNLSLCSSRSHIKQRASIADAGSKK